MSKKVLDKNIIDEIIQLRKTGHSLPEICKLTNKGNATVYKYCKDIEVLPEYQDILKSKQGGSKKRAVDNWDKATKSAIESIPAITKEHKLIILACLYWAEGRKFDFDLINSDPELIRVFLSCLKEIGVTKDQLRASIRVYSDIDKEKVVLFWQNLLEIDRSQIIGIDVLIGKKEGKLKYGMCRVRIVKGGKYFKEIMSLVQRIKNLI